MYSLPGSALRLSKGSTATVRGRTAITSTLVFGLFSALWTILRTPIPPNIKATATKIAQNPNRRGDNSGRDGAAEDRTSGSEMFRNAPLAGSGDFTVSVDAILHSTVGITR